MIKRVPLTGTYNTRLGTVLSGTAAIVGIAIVGRAIVGQGASGSSKDTRFLNCLQITQTDELAQSKRLKVVKRPGLVSNLTPAAGSIGTAIHIWTGQGTGAKIMSCFGGTNSTLYDSTTSKGAITGVARGITETSISSTPTLTIASEDSTGWYYQDGGAATKIADVDFPGNASRTTVGNFAHLDGYPFIMDSVGRIYNGDLNSITAWTAAAYLTANSVPDVGVGVIRHRNTLVGFCKTHFEVFRNAGNPAGSPLTRIEELTQKIGCISADAITEIRDTIYFVGTTDGANVALYSYNGGQVEKLSIPEIENKLVIAGPSSISVTTLGFFGRHFLIICASTFTMVYCLEEKTWHEWTGLQLWCKASGVKVGSSIVNYAVTDKTTTGKVYLLNPSSLAYQDDGEAFTATIQTSGVDFGSRKKKTCNSIDVICDRETSTSNLSIAWSDNDYQTHSAPRTVDLSSDLPRLTRGGRFRKRSFLLNHSANTPMGIEALELDIEAGAT